MNAESVVQAWESTQRLGLSRPTGLSASQAATIIADWHFLRAKIDRLREALKPFAAHGDYIDKEFPDDHDDTMAGGHEESFMTLGDFRRARAAYEGGGK